MISIANLSKKTYKLYYFFLNFNTLFKHIVQRKKYWRSAGKEAENEQLKLQ